MNTKKILATALIASLAFASCSKDEQPDNFRKEVKIVTSIEESGEAKTKASFNPDGSGTFDTGDSFYVDSRNPSGARVMWRHEVGSALSLFWEDLLSEPSETTVDFRAWYPIDVLPEFYTQFYEVASAASEAAQDLLIARKVTVAVGNVVNLQFKHVMHKLIVNLSSNDFPSLEQAIVSLKNLKSSASVDFWNATVNATLAKGTELYASKTGASTSFIVAPQTLSAAGTDLIEIAVEGKTFTYKIPSGLTVLESGRVLTLNLELKKDSGTVEDTGSNYNPGGGIPWN